MMRGLYNTVAGLIGDGSDLARNVSGPDDLAGFKTSIAGLYATPKQTPAPTLPASATVRYTASMVCGG